MNYCRFRAFTVLFVAMWYGTAASAADSFDYDPKFDPNAVTQWREGGVTLPAYPEERDLVSVPLSPVDTFRLYLDRNSLALGGDRVLRVTAVLESPTGARNVFYDGFRCETREYKTYALGSSARQWRQQAAAQWRFIVPQGHHDFRFQLYKQHLCDSTNTALAPAAILRGLVDIATHRY